VSEPTPAVGTALEAPAPFTPLALVRVLRPKQWTKNLALLAPLIFADRLFSTPDLIKGALATLGFCLLAGGVYVFNDLADREKDRVHPEKRFRPIASGALPAAVAAGWGAVCLGGALALAAWIGRPLLGAYAAYLVMQVGYTFLLKQVAILDVMIIALGFVLRVVAGALAIEVPVSNWLYLCTLCLALFLGFCKRRNELLLLEGGASAHRANLTDYSPALLDQLIGTTTAMTLVAYSLYTMSPETVAVHHTDNLKLTIPFVIYGVFRYLFLVYKRALGGSPEKILLSDVPMLLTVLGFGATAVGVLYSAH
jgi:4-hydroxybenzoate polyprenyltransferase